MNSVKRRVVSVILSIVIMLGMALPLYTVAISEEKQGASSQENAAAKPPEGLELSKSYDADKGILSIEAYVTGETVKTVTTSVAPSDIVIALDSTDSMIGTSGQYKIVINEAQLDSLCKDYAEEYKYVNGSTIVSKEMRWNGTDNRWEYKDSNKWYEITTFDSKHYVQCTRLVALKAAVTEFIRNTAEKNEGQEKKTRISILTFADDKTSQPQYLPAVISATEVNPDGFVEVDSTGAAQLIKAVSEVDVRVGQQTRQSAGIKKAYEILNNDIISKDDDTGKVFILFTDGYATDQGSEYKPDYDISIDYAYKMKNATDFSGENKENNKVSVYTVGLLGTKSTYDNAKKFLQYTSSNYPTATKLTDKLTASSDKYYYDATDSGKLSEIFKEIYHNNYDDKAKIEILGTETKLHDIISESFVLNKSDDENIQDAVHVYLSDYIGLNTWGTPVPIKATDNISVLYDGNRTIDVVGFDYSANWCGLHITEAGSFYAGKKIIATIPIKPADGVKGITGVDTNAPGSGIISPGKNKPIGDFPVPRTDVPTDVLIKKVCKGFVPDNAKFEVSAEASAHITGYEWHEVWQGIEDYTMATTKGETYSTTFTKTQTVYDGIKDILVASDIRQSTIKVTEKAVPAGYKVTFSDGTNTYEYDGNGSDIVSPEFTVTPDMEITITNNKLNPDSNKVTLENEVTGDYGDKNMDFLFTGSYMSSSSEQQISQSLKHGASKDYEIVDFGSTFIVSATNSDGYSTSVYLNGQPLEPQDGVYKFTVNGDTTVKFVHDKSGSVETGLQMDFLPYVLILAVVVAGAVIFIVRRKRASSD